MAAAAPPAGVMVRSTAGGMPAPAAAAAGSLYSSSSSRSSSCCRKGVPALWLQPGCAPAAQRAAGREHRSGILTTARALPPAAADLQDAVCDAPDYSTQDFVMQQTMLRIKDPKASLDFYTRVLGMRLLCSYDFPEMTFSLYFVGYADPSSMPADKKDRAEWAMRQPGCVELTHNWGTEADAAFAGYHNGNADPRGFGHIGISVPDVYAACKRFEELGVEFVKKPDDGKMQGLAFIKDPDGYWVEVFNAKNMRQFV